MEIREAIELIRKDEVLSITLDSGYVLLESGEVVKRPTTQKIYAGIYININKFYNQPLKILLSSRVPEFPFIPPFNLQDKLTFIKRGAVTLVHYKLDEETVFEDEKFNKELNTFFRILKILMKLNDEK